MIDDKYIGALIRNLRVASDFTLTIVAEKTGLSKSLLSRIEHGIVSPPLTTLAKIADALDVHISTFFREDGTAAVSSMRADQRTYITASEPPGRYKYATLVREGYGRKLMSPFAVRIQRRGFKPVYATVSGDQFIFIIDGALDYMYASTVYHLGTGDAMYLRGEVPHGPHAIHSDTVEYVMVLTRRFTHAELSAGETVMPRRSTRN